MTTKPVKFDLNKINVITLGCSKNLVDSEVLLSQLNASKCSVTHEEAESDAGTLVINTCGFIDQAKQQSVDTILEAVERKKRGEINKIVVTGCLSERYRDQLEEEIPDVDAYFGTHDMPDLVKNLGGDYREELLGERNPVTESHYAYLKVSEGCDRGCSFCAIPIMRGGHKSREIDFLVKEAEYLVSKGVKEIMLIAQDLTYYGVDIYKKKALNELLERLSDVKGLEWLRLHYAYPSGFPVEILKTIRERDNICSYLDMPIQHASTTVLKRMRRAITRERTEGIIAKIREEIPDITLRTTVLVGHPGETDEDHEQLLEFLEETRLDRVGVFAYSHEEDTHSFTYEDDVPDEVKQQRLEDVMLLQQSISLEKNQDKVGKTLKVLIDALDEGVYIGRSEGDSPEVDNMVLIPADQELEVGAFYNVEITDAEAYDLHGRVVQ